MHSTYCKPAVLLPVCVIFPATIAWMWLWFILSQTLQSLASTIHRFLPIEKHIILWLTSLTSSSFSQEESTVPMGCLALLKFRYYHFCSVEICAHLCHSSGVLWTSILTLICQYVTDSANCLGTYCLPYLLVILCNLTFQMKFNQLIDK